jgi:hypothetical protein
VAEPSGEETKHVEQEVIIKLESFQDQGDQINHLPGGQNWAKNNAP